MTEPIDNLNINDEKSRLLQESYSESYSDDIEHRIKEGSISTSSEISALLNDEDVDIIKGTCGPTRTCLNLLKGCLGTGVLTMPYAFSVAGIAPTVLCLVVTSFMNFVSVAMLVFCFNVVTLDVKKRTYTSLSAVSYNAFGQIGCYVSDFLIVVTAFGAGVSFLIFIEDTMSPVVQDFNQQYWVIISVVPICILVLFKNLAWMSIVSMIGLMLLFVAFGTVFGYGAIQHDFTLSQGDMIIWNGVPTAFSLCSYAFAFPIIFFPQYDQMKFTKNKEKEYLRVQAITLVLVSVILFTLGFVSYGFFAHEKDPIAGSIIRNLPETTLCNVIRCSLALVILLSYPLSFFLPHQMVANYFKDLFVKTVPKQIADMAARIGMTIVAAVVAIFVPDFSKFVSVIGAFTVSICSYVMPPLIYYVTFKRTLPMWQKVGSFVYFLVSVVLMVYNTYAAIADFVNPSL